MGSLINREEVATVVREIGSTARQLGREEVRNELMNWILEMQRDEAPITAETLRQRLAYV
jgi:hypothetical protein